MFMSFQEFTQQSLITTNYPLNGIAQSYLQEWEAGQTIAILDGGIAFETQLRKLKLDGSITSLIQLDKFLEAVKPHLMSDYRLLPHETAQRNLLTFIAFYTGMVWAYQTKFSPYWMTHAHLTQQYPTLNKAIDNDFSYSLAVSCEPISKTVDDRPLIMLGLGDSMFFPLVTIIERLYPRRQNANQSQAPFFGYINDSLEKSVTQLMTAKTQSPELERFDELLLSQNHAQPQLIQPLPNNSLIKNLGLTEVFLISDKQVLMDFDNDFFEIVRTDYQHPFLEKQVAQLQVESQSPVMADEQRQLAQPISEASQVLDKPIAINAKKAKNITFTAKQIAKNRQQEKQARERERQIVEQETQKRLADALANPQYHEGLLNQRKSMVDEKKSVKVVDTFTELEKSLKITQAPSQKAVETDKNETLLQAEQKANALLASEQRKAKRLAEEKLSGKLIKDISKVNQLTEAGKPKELDSFDILLPQTIVNKANPDSTGNSEIDDLYYQTCQTLASLQEQTELDANLVKQTLATLQQFAKQNHSGALLQLALLRFRGEPSFNVAKDEAQALKLVQASAKLNDHRAQKLLSRLYFSGQGVPLSTELGNYWLEQSASHGNTDAKKLLAEMAIAQELRHTKQNDTVYLERLLMGVVALVVFALAVIFFIRT